MSNYFCTNSGRDTGCGCPPQPSCPQEPVAVACCPCAEDFRKALDLLCSPRLQPLVNFAAFAFVSDYYLLGASLTAPATGSVPGDNLTIPAGSYVCGGDSCNALTVSGSLYPPVEGAAPYTTTITQAALCGLRAIAFDAAATAETPAANFQTISQILGQLLRPQKPESCGSMADTLTNAAAIRASTVTAGPLVVENSTIIGQIGEVLVMANSTDNRFYLICADRIGFMG